LVQHPALYVGTLVYAFSEPFLNRNVPAANLFTRVDGRLENPNVDRINAVKRGAVETYSRSMHCAHAQFPSEVVLAAKQVN
jgi:hypothetical protein